MILQVKLNTEDKALDLNSAKIEEPTREEAKGNIELIKAKHESKTTILEAKPLRRAKIIDYVPPQIATEKSTKLI